ncbi:MAG: 2-oxo acid dehydrogenase subunit E2 [Acidobacteria bacterium]|nr:MAG: 2-oxo acid dehydrogenase subunit E2 [Acidobacteriota bacterium]
MVRKIAAEHNLDIRDIPGTGIAGRVTKQDILSHIDAKPAEAPAPFPPRPAPTPAPVAAPAPRPPSPPPAVSAPSAAPSPQPSAPTASSRVEVVPMSPIRKKTAEHMVLSKRTSAHVTTVFEIDMTRVDQLRKKYRQQYEERSGVKLTYMPFILKATIDALKALPVLNSSVEGDAIVYRHDINIGIAVALDWGLIVPVIRNADEKNVLGLARAVNDLAERARSKRLKVDEVQGGTFTITNPGVFGSLFGTPIINQPQVAILGIGVIEKRTVVRDDAIAIRTMAYFALSFDHRIVDGSDADRFMAHIKKGLQEFDESAL